MPFSCPLSHALPSQRPLKTIYALYYSISITSPYSQITTSSVRRQMPAFIERRREWQRHVWIFRERRFEKRRRCRRFVTTVDGRGTSFISVTANPWNVIPSTGRPYRPSTLLPVTAHVSVDRCAVLHGVRDYPRRIVVVAGSVQRRCRLTISVARLDHGNHIRIYNIYYRCRRRVLGR